MVESSAEAWVMWSTCPMELDSIVSRTGLRRGSLADTSTVQKQDCPTLLREKSRSLAPTNSLAGVNMCSKISRDRGIQLSLLRACTLSHVGRFVAGSGSKDPT